MQLIFLKARVGEKKGPVGKYLKYGSQTKERNIPLSPSNEDFEEARRIHVQNASLQHKKFKMQQFIEKLPPGRQLPSLSLCFASFFTSLRYILSDKDERTDIPSTINL